MSQPRENRLPILIIPGFMSSGLSIQSSTLTPRWTNKKLWLNLSALGFQGKFLADARDIVVQDERDTTQQVSLCDDWMAHMILGADMTTEQKGVEVRAVPGLEGVEYLESHAFIKGETYVFGRLTDYLVNSGEYRRGKDLDAVPYDWRVPFYELERRDGYFSRTCDRIEEMQRGNEGRRVVLLCHSMGNLVGHYLLLFARKKRGQGWIDTNIDTYMCIGAPHLGASFTSGASVNGDTMGLPSAFLDKDNTVLMSRSFGSTMHLQMVNSDGKPHTCIAGMKNASIVRRCDYMMITIHSIDLKEIKHKFHPTSNIRVKISLKGEKNAKTTWFPITNSMITMPQNENIYIPIPLLKRDKMQIRIELQIDHLSDENEQDKDLHLCPNSCCGCLCCLGCCPFFCCYKIIKLPLRLLWSGTAAAADLMISSSTFCMGDFSLNTFTSKETSVPFNINLDAVKKIRSRHITGKANISANVLWITEKDFHAQHNTEVSSPSSLPFEIQPSEEFLPVTTIDMFKMEKLDVHLKLWEDLGRDDLCCPSTPPPVGKVYAIYGINIPTEIRQVYTPLPKSNRKKKGKKYKNFEVDESAVLPREYLTQNGYTMNQGIVKETKETPQVDIESGRSIKCSGDGTVPYDSLQHVKMWKNDTCNVQIEELEGAEHRTMLKDPRVFSAILNYCSAQILPHLQEEETVSARIY